MHAKLIALLNCSDDLFLQTIIEILSRQSILYKYAVSTHLDTGAVTKHEDKSSRLDILFNHSLLSTINIRFHRHH